LDSPPSLDASTKQHTSPSPESSDATAHNHVALSEHGEVGEHHAAVERYPVMTVDFSRVETPFIIGIWILFASIAKIGE
jgi:hypothetical protein